MIRSSSLQSFFSNGVPLGRRAKTHVHCLLAEAVLPMHACNQGCRQYNEDAVFIDQNCQYPLREPNFHVVGMLDGHGGSKAVYCLHRLMHEMLNNKERLARGLEPIQYFNVFFILRYFYERAFELLKHEHSGVVSVVALIFKRKVIFGWLGDCEGCVFVKRKEFFFDPIYKHKNEFGGPFYEFDLSESKYASCEFLHKNAAERHHFKMKEYAKTRAHNFNKSVQISDQEQWKWYLGVRQDGFCRVMTFRSVDGVTPERFGDMEAQTEYDLMSLKRGSPVLVDATKMKIGLYESVLDTRLANAIQPTRSLGDCGKCNESILRDCCIMEVDLDSAVNDACHVLLCSDGFFHGGAYASIERLCSFFIDPVLFIKMFLYHGEQEVTLRLMACGLLPPLKDDLNKTDSGFPLLDAWKTCENSMEQAILFLLKHHMAAIGSPEFCSTYDSFSVAGYTRWLETCRRSCTWLEQHGRQNDTATLATHLGILMGSQDNISVVVSPV